MLEYTSIYYPDRRTDRSSVCLVGWWLMVGTGLFWDKSTAGWLLMAGLLWEKSTSGWWLISQANRVIELQLISSFLLITDWWSSWDEYKVDNHLYLLHFGWHIYKCRMWWAASFALVCLFSYVRAPSHRLLVMDYTSILKLNCTAL
jgi:hypothetical protein